MRRNMIATCIFAATLLFASAALAQVEDRHELSVQGTGFFTKDSQESGISQHSTNTGGLLVGYRFHFSRWLAADASYGYDRSTQQSFSLAGPTNVQANVHQATGALVVTLPVSAARLKPYALAGAGALVFDPTGNPGGFVPEVGSQAKATFVYGAGVDYRISHNIALRAEYRGLVYNRPDFGLADLNSNVTAHTAQPSAGIVFRF
ncbi:MAG TPA: porin family protein [Acidobacteriota bacterium]|nr:porin family protein [Acidobacteriota bacterium]